MFLTKTKKSPYYQIVYEVNGKRTTTSTKTTNRVVAEEFLNKFVLGEIEDINKIKPIKLSKFQNEYCEYIQLSKSSNYLRSVKLSFSQFKKFVGDIYLNRIDSRLLDKFITSTFARSQYAAALYYRSLKAAFTKAVVWNYLNHNPFKKLKLPRITKSLPVFINESEFHLILQNTKEQYMKNIFIIAFDTGMRLSELLHMSWNWINFDSRLITVKNSHTFTTKNKNERIIPMSKSVYEVLTNKIRIAKSYDSTYVFSMNGELKLNEEYISKQFKKAVRSAKLNDKIHFHTLRHSFASRLVQKGISLYVIKELLGHEDLATTQIYSHLQQQNLRDALSLL